MIQAVVYIQGVRKGETLEEGGRVPRYKLKLDWAEKSLVTHNMIKANIRSHIKEAFSSVMLGKIKIATYRNESETDDNGITSSYYITVDRFEMELADDI